jgi:hypothetical protein
MDNITDSVRTVIGTDTRSNCFQGNFDGNDKKITLALSPSYQDYIGLFCYIYNGTIKNLAVDGFVSGRNIIGGICGYASNSDIINCINYCKISGRGDHISGICGLNIEGNILNCINYGKINGSNMLVGGIVGASNGKIINCKNYGNVDGAICVGGIIGHTEAGCNISYCVNSGSITASNYSNYGVGGIIGHFKGDTISHCINIGTITGKYGAYAGGIVGMGGFEKYAYSESLIYSCINSGFVTGTTITGGIIGFAYNGDKIVDCINTGAVSSSIKAMGCIAGKVEAGGDIENCYYDKQVCGGEE